MIEAACFLTAAQERGFRFFTGVPCSFLTPLINQAIGNEAVEYLGAANEGEAVAIAAGAWLAGSPSLVMCQNSGLGNTVNALTSLNYPFRIPCLLVCTWRGKPDHSDEPQHELMGQVLPDLLDAIRVPHSKFPGEMSEVSPALDAAVKAMAESELPFALLVDKGAIREEDLHQPVPPERMPGIYQRYLTERRPAPTRAAALERVLRVVPSDVAIVATTGKCSRELFTLCDREQHFYQVGCMGGASALALGVALHSERTILVLDGDGSALMKLGNFATIGARAPHNLVHVVLDNGVHDSTGGQRTASATVRFTGVALACGYKGACDCDDADGFETALASAIRTEGPHLIHMRIAPGSMENLGRPTVGPYKVARRFQNFLIRADLSQNAGFTTR